MVGWQRHIQSVVRLLGSKVHQHCGAGANFSIARAHARAPPLPAHFLTQQRTYGFPANVIPCLFHRYLQELGISTFRRLSDSTSETNMTPVASPLVPVLAPNTSQTESQTVFNKPSKVQAIRKNIKQSPKKVNLVAALVRGMRVEDALLQLQVTIKRASKTVYQVINSARANATHNHGMDPDRLLVAEAFVGKGFYKKRVSYHSKGRSGIKMRPECRLTVVVREITPEEEAEIAKLRVAKFKKMTKREKRLVPHQLIETTPRWGRKRKQVQDGATSWDT